MPVDFDFVMNSVCQTPAGYRRYANKVGGMEISKEVTDSIASKDIDNVKRSHYLKKQLKLFTKSLSIHYNLVHIRGKEKICFYALIHFLGPKSDRGRRGWVVLAAKTIESGERHTSTFERLEFDDFLLEVRAFINLLGDLYHRRTKV